MAAMRRLFTLDRDLVRKLFPPGGGHFRLRLGPDGSCVFLGEDGCRLPRQVRPWYCLLFPAWIQGRTATLFQPETCLIARRAGSPAQGLAILGLTPDEARALYEALRRDWGLPSGATPL
jgi:Fe-S-cluster containining protein